MNKIKVIDLLNMISKGEEVPKKIAADTESSHRRKMYQPYLQCDGAQTLSRV